MIAFVRGEVAAITLTSAVLEVGGVGLEVMCTPGTLATLRVGRQATLPTSMVVREDSLTVFGFLDDIVHVLENAPRHLAHHARVIDDQTGFHWCRAPLQRLTLATIVSDTS